MPNGRKGRLKAARMPTMAGKSSSPDHVLDGTLLIERAQAYATGAHAAVGQRHKREPFPMRCICALLQHL